jgi:pyruvate ferredoxin oxidoreductase alpha subunit
VDKYLPPYQPDVYLNPKEPHSFNALVMPDVYMEMRYKIQQAMDRVFKVAPVVGKEFTKTFGRSYDLVEAVECDDAETVLVTSGTTTSPARVLVKQLRAQDRKIGLLKLRYFRPFPTDRVRKILRGKKQVVVIDRNISFGKGGIWADELRGALAGVRGMPQVYGYVAGLGGRDITPGLLGEIVEEVAAKKRPDSLIYWKGMKP